MTLISGYHNLFDRGFPSQLSTLWVWSVWQLFFVWQWFNNCCMKQTSYITTVPADRGWTHEWSLNVQILVEIVLVFKCLYELDWLLVWFQNMKNWLGKQEVKLQNNKHGVCQIENGIFDKNDAYGIFHLPFGQYGCQSQKIRQNLRNADQFNLWMGLMT